VHPERVDVSSETLRRAPGPTDASDEEREQIVEAAIPLVKRQLELVAARQERLGTFGRDLKSKLRRLERRRRQLVSTSRA
jgi:hypothetical protein